MQRLVQQVGSESVHSNATTCDTALEAEQGIKKTKSLPMGDLGDAVPLSATLCENSGGGIRTPDTRIMIPLL